MIRTLALSAVLVATPLWAVATSTGEQLLEKMATATRTLDYQGRFLYQFGAELSTMEIRHGMIDGVLHQRLTHLDGHLVEVVRRGDDVLCLHPDQTITRLDAGHADPMALGSRLRDSGLPVHYQVHQQGDARVAGRAATRLHVVPQDEYRYGYRLWLDQESSLLLKSEVVEHSGVPLERMEFVTLELAPSLHRDDFILGEGSERVRLSPGDYAGLDDGSLANQQWRIRPLWLPAGFTEKSRDLRRTGQSQVPVVAQGYSDGLAAFTIFVEPVGQRRVEEGVSRVGPTVAISRQLPGADGFLLTLVGEIPVATADRIIRQIELVVEPVDD